MRHTVNDPTHLHTAAGLLAAGRRLEHCELWDGHLLAREPAGGLSGPVEIAIAAPLHQTVRRARLGWVVGSSAGFLLRRDPDRLLSPDVAFISRKRLPAFPRRGFIPLAPDFVAEVKSPTDAWVEVVEKCGIWIAHGVQVAWAVDPDRRRIAVLRPATRACEILEGGSASAAPAVPGFELALSDIFDDLDPA